VNQIYQKEIVSTRYKYRKLKSMALKSNFLQIPTEVNFNHQKLMIEDRALTMIMTI